MRRIFSLAVVLGLVVYLGFAAFRAGATPEIAINPGAKAIGKRTPITIQVAEPARGLSSVLVEFVQGDRVEVLQKKNFSPLAAWAFFGKKTDRETLQVDVGRETLKDLEQGTATIRVTAGRAGSWLRHPAPVVEEISLPVRLIPPSLGVVSSFTYVNQGGCEAVVYRAGESAVRHGVQAGDWFFPGYPLPGGGPQDRFAFFAIPYDMQDVSGIKLVAVDDVGNEARTSFIDKFFPKPLGRDTIRLNEAFMNKVVPEIMSQTPELADKGSLLENYLQINRDLRKVDNATLKTLSAASKPAFLWSRPFVLLDNAAIKAHFADRRTYVYQGRTVDQQDHLGLDIAKTQAVPVPAANDGVIVLAKFLGIYGNTVVVDHGYGLLSLYGHLSAIEVKEGQAVKRGDPLGRTGATGLAFGDHLHFTLVLGGLPVSPIEWIDDHWIQDRIARKLGSGFAYVAEPSPVFARQNANPAKRKRR